MGNPSRTQRHARPMSAGEAAELAQRRAQQKVESQKRKEQFLVFVKALCRDLAQMDPAMHARAKKIIQDCTEKKKKRVPGFDFETNLRTQLFDLVGPSTWRRVERDLHRNTIRQHERKTHQRVDTDTSLSSHSSTASISLPSSSDDVNAEPRQPTEERGLSPTVTITLNDLSLSDGSVEVKAIKEQVSYEKKSPTIVQTTRPPNAVVVPAEQETRYIYI